MLLALMSDIHANLRAFDACLAHARSSGAAHVALLGDLVGYGAEPAEVIGRAQALAAQGAVVLRGNHDVLAAQPRAQAQTHEDATAQWTHERLSPAQRDWLTALPLTHRLGAALLVHASAAQPAQWRYVRDAQAAAQSLEAALAEDPAVRYVLGGHVHEQYLYYRGTGRTMMPFAPTAGIGVPVPGHRHWVATIGSVGQPRDGDPRAAYALLDLAQRKLTFQRVAYDHAGAARSIRAAGLSDLYAQRVEGKAR